MRFFSLLIGLATTTLSATVGAQTSESGLYGEVGYVSLGYSEPSTSATLGALRLFIGNNASENVMLEAMFGNGVVNGSGTLVVPYSLRVGNMLGIYGKAKTKLSPELEWFGRVGYLRMDRTLEALGTSTSDTGDDISYGTGLGYKVSPKAYLTADYMSYYNKNNVSFQGFTVGVRFRF